MADKFDAWRSEIAWHGWLAQFGWNELRKHLRRPGIVGFVPALAKYSGNKQALIAWNTGVWGYTWIIVSSAAVIANILWPGQRRREATAKTLRQALDLPPTPELQKLRDRSVRDALEHVEQSAPGWQRALLREKERVEIVAWSVGDGSDPPAGRGVPVDCCYRYLNRKTWDLRVGGASVNLKELQVDVVALLESIQLAHRVSLF